MLRRARLAVVRAVLGVGAGALCLQGLHANEIDVEGTPFRIDREIRRETYQLTWPLTPPADGKISDVTLAFIFAYQSANDFCRVDVTEQSWRVARRDATGEVILGTGRTGLPPGQLWRQFVLSCHDNRLIGVLGGQRIFRLFASVGGRGTAASQTAPKGLAGEPTLQAIAESEMVFRDDFMRSPEESRNGVWETLSGAWNPQSYADEWKGDSPLDPMNTSRNANPFVFRGAGTPMAVALAGYPFWDDLSGAVSVRSQGGRAGWLFDYRGPDDHYVLWWEPTTHWDEPSRFALERVRSGERVVLGEVQLVGQAEQWYRIGVERRGSAITASFQGVPVLRVRDRTCIGGRFGLCAADGEVDFDDVDVSPSALRPLEEESLRRRSWRRPLRRWEFVEDGARCLPGGWFGGEALLALGAPEWVGYRLAVSVETPTGSSSTVGVSLGVSAQESTCFEWESAEREGAERRLTVRSASGKSVLAKAVGGYTPGQVLRLIVDQSGPDLCVYEAMHGLLLRVPKHNVPAGRIGLIVNGRDKVEFRDMVLNGPIERDWELVVKTRIFETDHYMLDWSAAEGEWVRDEGADGRASLWWHKGDFFGAVELSLPVAAATTEGGVAAYLLATPEAPESGAAFRVNSVEGAPGELAAELLWGGKRIAYADFTPPPDAERIEIRKDGSFVWLRCGDSEPIFCQLPFSSALTGTRLGLKLASGELLEELVLRRDHVVDDHFDHVAVRWHKLGRWEVSNKFHCDPRWAYMVGESDSLASLWHLDSFQGDMTLEFYAGMRYRADHSFMPYYPRPGDINAVISSSGKGVFDGYTVVVSGWDTTWTRVLRNGTIVAETKRPLVPSTRKEYVRPQHLHRKWFYVKVRRIGPLVELYVENEKVLSWRDEKPLQGGRVALWTVDNSFLIARAKVSYSKRERFHPASTPGVLRKAPEEGTLPRKDVASGGTLRLVSDTHPGVLYTFDSPGDLEGWRETRDAGDAQLSWADEDADGGGGSLRAINVESGGQFRVPVPVSGLDVRRAAHLTFSCRMDPGVKVNLYATIGEKRYFLHLTGPDEEDENLHCLGRMPMQADGRWHRLFLPLGEVLLSERPLDRRLLIRDMEFGVERGGYLLAGRGGNAAGASFLVDDFEIAAEGGTTFKAMLQGGAGSGEPAGTFAIQHVDGAVICADQPLQGGKIERELECGLYTLRVGLEGMGRHREQLRFKVTEATPSIASVTPASGSGWGGGRICIRLSPGPLPALGNLVIRVAGRSYSVGGKGVSWVAETRSLFFDAASAGLTLTDGQSCTFALAPKWGGGKPLGEWTLVFRLADDTTPPGPVRVQEYAIHDTFEDGIGTWARSGPDRAGREHSALLIRDDRLPASGSYSLKLFNELVGGLAGAQISTASINAGKHPIVSFDCRMEEEVLVDLLFTGGVGQSRITLTDNDHRNTAYHVGSFSPTIVPDGCWQHVEVNWHDLLAALPYSAANFSISNLRIGDFGWTGNREGATYWIDNFRVAPTLSTAGSGLPLRWSAADPAGVGGYSYHWSPVPEEDADTEMDGTATSGRFTDVPEGRQYFHIRAVDRAGNWGETTHWLVLVDGTSPQIREVFPAPDAVVASREIRVLLEDSLSGVDPASLRLTVNGRSCSAGGKGVMVDLSKGLFSLDWLTAGVRPKTVGETQSFDVVLNPVRDFAGNTTERQSWTWTLTNEGDVHPPSAPQITWRNGTTLKQFDFEEAQPALSASTYFPTDRPFVAERGSRVLRTRIGASGTTVALTIPGQVDTSTYRYLSFRYCFPPELKVDFSGMLETREPDTIWLLTKLTDGDVRPDYVFCTGRVDGITCDNQWHSAMIDLRKQVEVWHEKKPQGAATSFVLKSLAIGDMGFNWHAVGTTFLLDDVLLAAPGPATAEFSLNASDESGIAGYACSIDRDPDGIPPDEVVTKPGEPFKPSFPGKGTWYVHARARDIAGNWSRPGHLAFVVE